MEDGADGLGASAGMIIIRRRRMVMIIVIIIVIVIVIVIMIVIITSREGSGQDESGGHTSLQPHRGTRLFDAVSDQWHGRNEQLGTKAMST